MAFILIFDSSTCYFHNYSLSRGNQLAEVSCLPGILVVFLMARYSGTKKLLDFNTFYSGVHQSYRFHKFPIFMKTTLKYF